MKWIRVVLQSYSHTFNFCGQICGFLSPWHLHLLHQKTNGQRDEESGAGDGDPLNSVFFGGIVGVITNLVATLESISICKGIVCCFTSSLARVTDFFNCICVHLTVGDYHQTQDEEGCKISHL